MKKTFELTDSTGRKWKCSFFTNTVLSMDALEYVIRRYRIKKTPILKFDKTLIGGIFEDELPSIPSLEIYAQGRIESYLQDTRQEEKNLELLENLLK